MEAFLNRVPSRTTGQADSHARVSLILRIRFMNRDQTRRSADPPHSRSAAEQSAPPEDPHKKTLTMQEVADLMHVSRPTAWRWALTGVKNCKLTSYLHGGRRVVDSADLEKFRQQLKQRPLGTACESNTKSIETANRDDALAVDEALECLLNRPAQRQNRPPRTINSRTESQ